MAGLFRCYNCKNEAGIPGRDFIGEGSACPECKLDTNKDKRFAGRIIRLEITHFDPPHPFVKGCGTNLPACGKPRASVNSMSGEPSAVNCPNCRKTQAFLDKESAIIIHPEDDFEIPK